MSGESPKALAARLGVTEHEVWVGIRKGDWTRISRGKYVATDSAEGRAAQHAEDRPTPVTGSQAPPDREACGCSRCGKWFPNFVEWRKHPCQNLDDDGSEPAGAKQARPSVDRCARCHRGVPCLWEQKPTKAELALASAAGLPTPGVVMHESCCYCGTTTR